MGKIRRVGYVFLTWKGDHTPRDGRLVLKWDLENRKAMVGRPTRRVLDLIEQLQREKLL